MVETIKLQPVGFFSVRRVESSPIVEGLACRTVPQLFDPPGVPDTVILEVSHRRTFMAGWSQVDCYHVAWSDVEIIEIDGERLGVVRGPARVIGVLRR